jgi:hypothetical protein
MATVEFFVITSWPPSEAAIQGPYTQSCEKILAFPVLLKAGHDLAEATRLVSGVELQL